MMLLPWLAAAAGQAGAEGSPPVLTAVPVSTATPTPPPEPASGLDGETGVRVLLADGSVAELTMEEYLWRVVAAEMPAAFEEEALKAQAVCARTYTLWKMAGARHSEADICADPACCQAYRTPVEMAQRWGELAEEYTARIAGAVADTDGMVLTYGGELIQAVFFSSSAASTEDAAAVWGESLPYLVAVDSPEGEEVPNYRSTVVLTAAEVQKLAEDSGLGIRLSGEPERWLGEPEYNASGRVAAIRVGDVTLSGGAARSLFGLRSACFTVEEKEGVFTFSVTGYGHGVGMSQYGANAMARAGSSWEDIVRHYYTGVELTKLR